MVVFGVLRKVPYDNVPYGRDARELQGKDGNDSDAKVPTDLEGKMLRTCMQKTWMLRIPMTWKARMVWTCMPKTWI